LILLEIDHLSLERDLLIRLEENFFRRPLVPGFEVAIVSDTGEILSYRGGRRLDASFLHSADAIVPLVAPGGWLFPFEFTTALTGSQEPYLPRTGTLSLVAKHQAGSLAAAINRRRTYHLLEAFGILLLLAAAAVTLLLSVQKTRDLARRQMDFVAGISHELRNPLTAIQSAGFNLSKGTVYEKEKIQKYGRIISKESRRLTHMIEQVLSYAGIQRSARQYDRQSLRLEEVVEEVLRDYSEVLEEEDWEVEVQIEEDLQPLAVDPKALRSCLSNLIDNSLKYAGYTKNLRIEASSEQDAGQSWIHVSVRDKGRGIPGSELPNVFQPFFRGSHHVASPTPGTGLGLAIVKSHVEAHGGKVRVESKPGFGTEFILSFPTRVSDEKSDGSEDFVH
jgi:two-component system phosphate regulon sensor histidine kinase PhoR